MTSYEHFMLGFNGTLAAGLQRRCGWSVAAMAGVAAVLPDWDGLSLVFGAAAFDRVHRTWGHNVFAAVLLATAVAVAEYRYGGLAKVGGWFSTKVRLSQQDDAAGDRAVNGRCGWLLWIAVAVAASLSHIGTDMLFSGHATLSDWGIRLFWPFSSQEWVYPMVPWGDPAVSILFAAGMFAMFRWSGRLQGVATVTLAAVAAYVLLRGWVLR